MKLNPYTYLGNPKLKQAYVPVSYTQDQLNEYIKCSLDYKYFMETYIQIVTLDYGKQLFKLYAFQADLVDVIHQNRYVIAKIGRQMGKTTICVAYILWHILFREDTSVAILANKLENARGILKRLKNMYEGLPFWLQQGVVTWNKTNIELENKSLVDAAATSSDGIRSRAYNLVLLDEFAHIDDNMADEFFTSTYPVISSGKSTKLVIVSTPKGLNHFYKLWQKTELGKTKYVPFETHWSQVPGRDEAWKQETIANTSADQFRQEYETEFLGSTDTLINHVILRDMVPTDPKSSKENLDIFEDPVKDHIYCMTVDSGHGKGIDYSAFSVIDITEFPYKQVARFRDNNIQQIFYPQVIYQVAKHYNNADVALEINDVGGEVRNILYLDLEYPNIISFSGRHIDDIGIRMTKQVKAVGCNNLKTLIESYQLVINDEDTIGELRRFVKKKGTWKADEGSHDDLVMGLVMFSWLCTQQYFKDLTDRDIREKLYDDREKEIEDDVMPFGFIDDGTNSVDDDQLWEWKY